MYNSLYSDNYDDPIPVIVHPKSSDPGFNVPTIPICKNIPTYFTNTSSIALFPITPPEQITAQLVCSRFRRYLYEWEPVTNVNAWIPSLEQMI